MNAFPVRGICAFQPFSNEIQITLTDFTQQIILATVMIVERCAVDACLLAKLTDEDRMKRHRFEQLQQGAL